MHAGQLLPVHDDVARVAHIAAPVEFEAIYAADAPGSMAATVMDATERQPPQSEFVNETHIGVGAGTARGTPGRNLGPQRIPPDQCDHCAGEQPRQYVHGRRHDVMPAPGNNQAIGSASCCLSCSTTT